MPVSSRRWVRWLLAGAAALAIFAVVGPYVYIHVIEGKAPPPLAVGTLPAPPPQAGYRVGEVLFGQNATAVGRTSAITGAITLSGAATGQLQVTAGTFSVDMTTVKSDQSQRDGQFQRRIMNTAAYPTASFVLAQPVVVGSAPPDGAIVTETATGKLTLHGTARAVTFPITAKQSAGSIAVSGSIPVTFANYGISNPSGGPATTQDHGTMEFALVFAPDN